VIPPPVFLRAHISPPPHPTPAFIGGVPLLNAAFVKFYGPQLDTTNAPLDSSRDAGINTGDGPHDPSIKAGDGRDPGIDKADGGVESGANTVIDGKNSPEVVKKTRTRAK